MDIKWVALEKVLNEFADYFIQLARDNLQANGSIASSELINSFDKKNVVVKIEEEYYSVSIELVAYWKYVEEGTGPEHKPDARSTYWPKIDAIKDWITVKHLPTDDVDTTAFLISRAIAGKSPNQANLKNPNGGIKAKPFFEPAKEEALSKFELAIDLAIEEDIDNYVISQIDDYMLEKFKEL